MIAVVGRWLRRSGAWYAAPLTLALHAPTIWESRAVLGTNWPSTIDVVSGSGNLLLILAVVAAGVLALQWRSADVLVPDTPRGVGYRLVPAVLVATAISLVHLVCATAVCVATAAGTSGRLDPTPILVVVVGVFAAAFIGVLAVQVAPTWLTPPLVGLAVFAVLASTWQSAPGHLVSLGGVGMTIAGVRPRPELLWSQVGWFLALIVAVTVVLLTRRRGLLVAVVGAVAGVVVAAAGASAVISRGADRFELAAVDWACTDSAPRLCALAEDRSRLERNRAQLTEAATRGAGLLEAPGTFWQIVDAEVPGHEAEFSLRSRYTDVQAAEVMLSAALPCSDDFTFAEYDRLLLAAEALVGDGLSAGAAWRRDAAAQQVAALQC